MKKTTLLIAIILATLTGAKAQETKPVTPASSDAWGMTVLKVHLHNFISITINSDDAYVDLEYRTAEDYDGEGVSALKEDHLIVSSLSPFIVKVNSSTPAPLNEDGIALNQEGSGVTIKAERGTTKGMEGAINHPITLSYEGENIIDSNTPSMNNTFNITYSGEGDGAYKNKYFGDGEPTVYTTNVIYTIASK